MVRQGSAKPLSAVRFRPAPPDFPAKTIIESEQYGGYFVSPYLPARDVRMRATSSRTALGARSKIGLILRYRPTTQNFPSATRELFNSCIILTQMARIRSWLSPILAMLVSLPGFFWNQCFGSNRCDQAIEVQHHEPDHIHPEDRQPVLLVQQQNREAVPSTPFVPDDDGQAYAHYLLGNRPHEASVVRFVYYDDAVILPPPVQTTEDPQDSVSRTSVS